MRLHELHLGHLPPALLLMHIPYKLSPSDGVVDSLVHLLFFLLQLGEASFELDLLVLLHL